MWKLAPLQLNRIHSPVLESSILIGRVLPSRTPYEEASGFRPGDLGIRRHDIGVRVPYFVYDDYYKAFFQHEWDFMVSDGKKLADEGDTVLIQKLAEADQRFAKSLSLREAAEGAWWEPKIEEPDLYKRKNVTHSILEVIYRLGDVIEPTTREPAVGDRYRKEMARTAQLYGKSNNDFDYETAPKRGWQKNKRDFTERRTYKKWHNFKKNDPYAIVG
jgi:hypothetical protein